MSMDHEKVFSIAKKDLAFNTALKAAGEKMPTTMFSDTLDKGMWVALYSGWILGIYGATIHMQRMEEWKQL